jgi:hypothetical protein
MNRNMIIAAPNTRLFPKMRLILVLIRQKNILDFDAVFGQNFWKNCKLISK